MILLIHGNDIVSSKDRLRSELDRDLDIDKVYLDGKEITLSEVVPACETMSILSLPKVIIIESLFERALTDEKNKVLKYLLNTKLTHKIIIFEAKEIDKKIVKKYFASFRVYHSQLPANLFKFLETVGLETPSSSIASLHTLNKQRSAEFIYTMLVRQWRYLIMVKDEKSISETGLLNWQAGKFQRQARVFNEEELIRSYRQLLLLDYQLKSGLTPYTMTQLLDLFILNL